MVTPCGPVELTGTRKDTGSFPAEPAHGPTPNGTAVGKKSKTNVTWCVCSLTSVAIFFSRYTCSSSDCLFAGLFVPFTNS